MSSQEIDALTQGRVQGRLRHRHRAGDAAARPQRGRRPLHLGEEGRAGVAARVAAQGLPALADDEGADLGERPLPADRLPGDRLLLGAEAEEGRPEEPRRGGPEAARDLREARASRCTSGPSSRASRSTRSSTASRSRPPSRRSSTEAGVIFCSFSEAVKEHPELVRQYLGCVVPVDRQLLRRAQLGRLLRRLVRVRARRACAARWSSAPTSGSTPRTPASSSAR